MILSSLNEHEDINSLLADMAGEDFILLAFVEQDSCEARWPKRCALLVSEEALSRFASSDEIVVACDYLSPEWGSIHLNFDYGARGLVFTYDSNFIDGYRCKTFGHGVLQEIIGQIKVAIAFERDTRIRAYRTEEILAMEVAK